MVKNVGAADRYIRFLVGISLLLNIIILKPGLPGTILLLLSGVVMLYTSFAGFCGLYTILKINSCPVSPGPPEKPETASH